MAIWSQPLRDLEGMDRQTDVWTYRFPLYSTGLCLLLFPLELLPCSHNSYRYEIPEQGKGTDDHLLPLGDWFSHVTCLQCILLRRCRRMSWFHRYMCRRCSKSCLICSRWCSARSWCPWILACRDTHSDWPGLCSCRWSRKDLRRTRSHPPRNEHLKIFVSESEWGCSWWVKWLDSFSELTCTLHAILEALITLEKCLRMATYMGPNYPHSWPHSSKNKNILFVKKFFLLNFKVCYSK